MRYSKMLAVIPALLLAMVSCSKSSETTAPSEGVIYEMNVRQYTQEGTFKAAQAELPRLKDLGVDIVWLMPIYEIGEKERKGSLGSYYAIKDYKTPNPEFGTIEDFDSFVAEAHRLGLKVVLDWVANHTSPDAAWVTEKDPSWYYRDSLGNTIVEYDWTDIAKLDYSNSDMRAAMLDAMDFWMDRGIDGFRCDMASLVPQDFWTDAISRLRKEHGEDLYFLAEGEEPWLHEAGFDVTYAWKLHHLLNDIAQGKAGVNELKACLAEDAERFPADARRLMFTSNHDENSWAGTEMERMGEAHKLMAMLTYTLPSSEPLLYTGQEVGFNHRFNFFEKDPIPNWNPDEHTTFYKELNALRHSHRALAEGTCHTIEESWVPANVFAFTRSCNGETMMILANLSGESTEYALPDARKWADAASGKRLGKNATSQHLDPWGWSILIRK